MAEAITHYTPFIRNAFLAMLAYRLRYYTGIVTYLVMISVNYFIWKAVYSGQEIGARIHGFTFAEMITYIAVGWVSRSMYFSDIDEEIDEIVRSGQISVYLLRPVNFQLMMLAQAFGGALFRASCFTLPLGIVICLIFPVAPPADLLSFFLFMFSTFVSFLTLAQFNFLIGMLSFSLKSIQGVLRAKYFIVQLFSGLLLPLSFFPEGARRMVELLPFQTIAYIPLQFYLGKLTGVEVLWAVIHQLVWTALLFLGGALCWRRMLGRLTLQGG